MAMVDVSPLIRILSYIYANIWIPIRLGYLRLKFNVFRPIGKVLLEIMTVMHMACAMVPITVLCMAGEAMRYLSKEWLQFICLSFEKAIGIDPDSVRVDQPVVNEPTGEDNESPTIDPTSEEIDENMEKQPTEDDPVINDQTDN